MSRIPLFVIVLVPIFGAGCRAVLGIDDLPAAANDAGAPEAAADVDAGDLDDAGIDVEGAEAAAPTWCTTVRPIPDFCDDCDHLPIIKYWDNINRTPDIGASGGGTIGAETTASVSPPQSAVLTMPPLIDKTRTASAFLQRSVHDAPPDMTIELEVRIDTEDFPAGGGGVPIVTLSDASGGLDIFVFRRASGTWFAVSDGAGGGPLMQLTTPIPVGQWTDLQVSIKNHPLDQDAGADGGADGGTDGRITVRVNERDAAIAPLPAVWQPVTEQKLVVGPIGSGPMGNFQIRVDNVRIWSRSDL